MKQKEQHFEIKKEYGWFLSLPLSEQLRVFNKYEMSMIDMSTKEAVEFMFNKEKEIQTHEALN